MDDSKILLKEFELLNTSTAPIVSKNITKDFDKNVRVEIIKKVNKDLEFDLIGVNPAFANALRRIMLSDVPSMAIEKVHIYNNTSIIQDEVLAHRLGLIPLKADPEKFQWKPAGSPDEGAENDTLEFDLKIKCTYLKKDDNNSVTPTADPDEIYSNHRVLTSDFKWIPKGTQKTSFRPSEVGPTEDDILVAKLRPGHEIDVKMFAVKGIGRDHAKFSPVCTAFYRLLPKIELKEKVKGERAEKLRDCFSPGVIGINSKKEAFVSNSRYDMCSRNVFRYDDLKDSVELSKVKNHFIFTVESVGAWEPENIVLKSLDVLMDKCDYFLKELDSTDST